MGRKRRQRSTAIRKRIEKKQREEARAKRRAAKASGGPGSDAMLIMQISRDVARACADAVSALETRLGAGPIRGWTVGDLSGDRGLIWLAGALAEACDEQTTDFLEMEIFADSQRPLVDKLATLEVAAPGLDLDWEVGFTALAKAIAHAEEPPEEEEGEEA